MISVYIMNILIIGAGNIGKAIAHDLRDDFSLTICDVDDEKLEDLEIYGETVKVDVTDHHGLVEVLQDFDIAVCAVPGRFGFDCVKASIEAGTDMVDVSFMPEDPLVLDEEAKEKGVRVVVDAGFGPGLTNLFLGRISEEMDHIEMCDIKIGGLPMEPKPPLYYRVFWSPYDLIEEYMRTARMVKEGKIVEIEPMEDISEVTVMGEEFEEFYSDGLRTLLKTIEADNIVETTLRWPGHLEKMKVLKELGFFDAENIEDTMDVILPKMRFESGDMSMIDMSARGSKDGIEREISYQLYDEEKDGFTSMSRTTGFTTAVITRLVAQKEVGYGVTPPETIGKDSSKHDFIIDELRERDIDIQTSQKPA